MSYGYMHAVADRLPEVSGNDKWIWQEGAEGCCHCIPMAVDLVMKGVRDAAGTLLSIFVHFFFFNPL